MGPSASATRFLGWRVIRVRPLYLWATAGDCGVHTAATGAAWPVSDKCAPVGTPPFGSRADFFSAEFSRKVLIAAGLRRRCKYSRFGVFHIR